MTHGIVKSVSVTWQGLKSYTTSFHPSMFYLTLVSHTLAALIVIHVQNQDFCVGEQKLQIL